MFPTGYLRHARHAARLPSAAVAFSFDDGTACVRNGVVHGQWQRGTSADHLYLHSVSGHWLNDIFSSCVEEVWTLAARQLCRLGTQGGVADLHSSGQHSSLAQLLCVWRWRSVLRIHPPDYCFLTYMLPSVASGNTERPEYLAAPSLFCRRSCYYRRYGKEWYSTSHIQQYQFIVTAILHRYTALPAKRPDPATVGSSYWH